MREALPNLIISPFAYLSQLTLIFFNMAYMWVKTYYASCIRYLSPIQSNMQNHDHWHGSSKFIQNHPKLWPSYTIIYPTSSYIIQIPIIHYLMHWNPINLFPWPLDAHRSHLSVKIGNCQIESILRHN